MSGGSAGLPEPIPSFNWGAFFLPPIWGIAHGQWPGIFFLPLWVFVDNMLRNPNAPGAWGTVLGVSMAAVTLAFQAGFAANANRFAWQRVAGRVTPERFAGRQRLWAIAGALTVSGMAVWIVVFLRAAAGGA